MKKLLTLITLSAIAMSSMFAVVASGKSATIQLNTSVPSTSVTYDLYYHNDVIDSGSTYDITVADLTEDSNTDTFSVKATSNLNSDLGVEVTVTPSSFTTTINDGDETVDSGITPEEHLVSSSPYLYAGPNDSVTVYSFYLEWEGNSSLTAGEYTSTITVEYAVQ